MSLRNRAHRVATAFALAFAAISVTVGSTVAAAPSHGVTASCLYKSFDFSGATGFELKKIVIEPPTALFGQWQGQAVGWQVIVQRSYPNNDGPYRGWNSIHVSRIEKTTASPDQAAALTRMSVRIGYVASVDDWPERTRSWFRTVVKLYRYNDDGTVSTHARHKIIPFNAYRDGAYQHTQYRVCDGAWIDQNGGPPFPI
jgi:hypothetical protein